jgi:hypothetical protein
MMTMSCPHLSKINIKSSTAASKLKRCR